MEFVNIAANVHYNWLVSKKRHMIETILYLLAS